MRSSGRELREQMLRDPAMASIPTVVITGDKTWSQRPDVLQAVAALAKPFEPDALLTAINQVAK